MGKIMIIFPVSFFICYLSFLFFSYKRLFFYGLFFQQEEYNNKSFFKFIFNKSSLIDKKLSAILFFYSLYAITAKNYLLDMFIMTALFLIFAFLTPNPTNAKFKKKLILTTRMKRLFQVSAFLFLNVFHILSVVAYVYTLHLSETYCLCNFLGYIFLNIQILPFLFIFSNILLSPFEWYIKGKYIKQAKEKLQKYNPVVIGITGSFGKTSLKNIVNHILSSVSNSFTTARSINTLMGITRVIREDLQENHKFFIVEIGTDGPGQIEKIVNLVKPKYGVLTAIGTAHLKKFKTIDAIAKEKFFLIENVKKTGGEYFINAKMISEKYLKKYDVSPTIFDIKNLKTTLKGIEFDLFYNTKTYHIFTPVLGEHQADNISLAFIIAMKLGVEVETIIATLKNLPQTEHRLEVKNKDNNITIIDDAFNSNIFGFKSALHTLNVIATEKKGRAILITPGMVELGNLHDKQHSEIAEIAIKTADVAIAVVPERIASFVNTFKAGKTKKQELVLVNSLVEAQKWLDINIKANDTILYENDLPDIYEFKINI